MRPDCACSGGTVIAAKRHDGGHVRRVSGFSFPFVTNSRGATLGPRRSGVSGTHIDAFRQHERLPHPHPSRGPWPRVPSSSFRRVTRCLARSPRDTRHRSPSFSVLHANRSGLLIDSQSWACVARPATPASDEAGAANIFTPAVRRPASTNAHSRPALVATPAPPVACR
jgi:hypothetical protein